MVPERLESIKHEYMGQDVVVDASVPELAWLRNMRGRVVTINCNGRALVSFDNGKSGPRYDVELDYLKVVDKPTKADDSTSSDLIENQRESALPEGEVKEKLSELEIARLHKDQN